MEERPSIGARLREARLRQGLEIAACAEATRIRERYLVAIEDDRYESLPDPAYVSGFVRAYAAHLGVEIAGPARTLPAAPNGRAPSRPPLVLAATRATPRGMGRRARSRRRPLLAAAALMAVATAVAAALWLGALERAVPA